MRDYVKKRYDGKPVPSNIWLGVSVEDDAHKGRIAHLKTINSQATFISFEPLIGPVFKVDLRGVAWAIVGGESGPRSRPMSEHWVTSLRDACERDKVAFFFKQWGGPRPKSGGRLLEGIEWNGFPWQVVPDEIMIQLNG
jgi:protein gp37